MKKTARASMVRMLLDVCMMALPKSVIPRASEYPDTAARLCHRRVTTRETFGVD